MVAIECILYEMRYVYHTHTYVYLHVIFNCSAKAAAERETNPIIIDNTHTQSWEMLVYVKLVSVRCHSQTSRCLQSRRISTA